MWMRSGYSARFFLPASKSVGKARKVSGIRKRRIRISAKFYSIVRLPWQRSWSTLPQGPYAVAVSRAAEVRHPSDWREGGYRGQGKPKIRRFASEIPLPLAGLIK